MKAITCPMARDGVCIKDTEGCRFWMSYRKECQILEVMKNG
jgi:hypothetical protein